MKAIPVVSVIIPSYNRSSVIGRAVRSVLAQTFTDFEVIVVDDGSSDFESTEISLREFNDPRVRLIHLPKNQGGAAARNHGVGSATGEFVAFLDSDDEWYPNKLERQIAILQMPEYRGKQTLVYCKTDVRSSATSQPLEKVWPVLAKAPGQSMGDYLFGRGGFLQTSSILLPRTTFKSIRFNEKLPRHQDFDLLLRIEAAGFGFAMADEVLTVLHWEDYHSTLRGFSAEFSITFLEEYSCYLSESARANFLFDHVIGRLYKCGRKDEARCFIAHPYFSTSLLTGKNRIAYLSYKMLGNDVILRSLVNLKHSLFRR